MTYTFIFFSSLVLTIFSTPFLINFLTKSDIVDKPGVRRVNKQTVPRMGGVIIFSTVLLFLFSFYPNLNSIRFVIIGGIIIAICGTFDDILGMKWYVKFIFEIVVAILVMAYIYPLSQSIYFFGITLPYPLDLIILGFFMLGVINSINLLDGLDGLASGFALLTFLMFFVFALILQNELLIILTTSLAGSLIGFLKYNAYPAKIFLGDTGSLVLGFFILVVALLTSLGLYQPVLDLTLPTIVLGVPIIDTIKVMVTRIFKRQNPFHPDKTHIHHVIFDNKIQHKFTVFIVQGATIIFLALALIYYKGYQEIAVTLFFVFGIILVFVESIFEKIGFISESFSKFYSQKIQKLPNSILYTYKKIMVPVAFTITGIMLVLLAPINSNLEKQELLFLLIMGIFVFSLAFIHYIRTREIAGIYVLLNTIVYLVFSSLSDTIYHSMSSVNSFLPGVIDYIFGLIFITVIFYMVLRERIFQNSDPLLTGVDLTMILFVAVLFIVNNILDFDKLAFLNLALFHSLIIYLLFKIISRFNYTISKYIFTFSFALPSISILFLLLK